MRKRDYTGLGRLSRSMILCHDTLLKTTSAEGKLKDNP